MKEVINSPGNLTMTCERCGMVKTLDTLMAQKIAQFKTAHIECTPMGTYGDKLLFPTHQYRRPFQPRR